jgi:hypothetical protein
MTKLFAAEVFGHQEVYLASEVDAEIAALREQLVDALAANERLIADNKALWHDLKMESGEWIP